MSLLFAERPLVINTQLAMKIGLNEAIVLQQLHYWLRDTNSGMECDGVRWIYNTTEQWLEQFPFLTRNSDAVVFSAKKRQWGSREDLACAQWIWGRIVGLYEQAASDDGEIMRPKEPNWTAWANDVRTMRMLDGRSHRQICEMFGRVQRDPFWVKNIMSPSKLREKWDELVIRLGRSPVQRCVNHISEPDTEIPPGFRG